MQPKDKREVEYKIGDTVAHLNSYMKTIDIRKVIDVSDGRVYLDGNNRKKALDRPENHVIIQRM